MAEEQALSDTVPEGWEEYHMPDGTTVHVPTVESDRIVDPVEGGAFPKVAGRCPACGYPDLFLGSGGWVTCAWAKCPDPTAVSDLLDPDHERVVLEATDG